MTADFTAAELLAQIRAAQGRPLHRARHLHAVPLSPCCDFHSRACEPPSELCCYGCTEAAHPAHADASTCSAPDLSGTST